MALRLRVGLLPEAVPGERGRDQRRGEHGRAEPRGAAGGERGGGEDLGAGVDPHQRGRVGGDRQPGRGLLGERTIRSVTGLALTACASALRRALTPPTTKIEASIGRASNRVIVMRPVYTMRSRRPVRRGARRSAEVGAPGVVAASASCSASA